MEPQVHAGFVTHADVAGEFAWCDAIASFDTNRRGYPTGSTNWTFDRRESNLVPIQNPMKDPQDQEFGAAAAADQVWVDQLADEGVTPEDAEALDTEPRAPRAAGKAIPTW
jgi:hypothetical protein